MTTGRAEPPITVHVRTPAVTFAAWHNVLIELWTGNASAAEVRLVATEKRKAARAWPAGAGTLSIVSVLKVSLPPDVRRAVEETVREMPAEIVAVAHAVESGGFVAATLRGLTAGLALIIRQRRPVRFFDELAPAARWLLQTIPAAPGTTVTTRDLMEAVEALRP
jgi:hypothetical protein